MSAYKSDFLNILASRGFIHQMSDAAEAVATRPLAEPGLRAFAVPVPYIR